MDLSFSIEQREGYAVVRADGEPTLGAFLSFIETIGEQSRGWGTGCVLFDLRGIRSLTQFTEHYAVGQQVVRELGHLQRIASVVPADRLTRASEKTARASGVNLSVFTEEAEAIRWLGA